MADYKLLPTAHIEGRRTRNSLARGHEGDTGSFRIQWSAKLGTRTFKTSLKQGEHLYCPCRECQRKTRHEIQAETSVTPNDDLPGLDQYQIVKCLGCETVGFRRAQGSDEDYVRIGYGDDDYEYQPLENFYPTETADERLPINDLQIVPEAIARIYAESLLALNFGQEVLCGVGVRTILEAVSKDRKALGSSLFAKIDSLLDQKVLTQDGAEILHKLRVLGNSSAHDVKPHTSAELSLAFDVIDHLLLGVYILPAHAKKTFKGDERSDQV